MIITCVVAHENPYFKQQINVRHLNLKSKPVLMNDFIAKL